MKRSAIADRPWSGRRCTAVSDSSSRVKWNPVTSTTAKHLTDLTTTPGLVYAVASNAIPDQLKGIPGVVAYYVSSYAQPIPLNQGVTASGEIALVRHDGETAKAYNYLFASSSNGLACYAGPHKDFTSHHFATSAPVPIESLFGHPLTKGKT